MTSIRCMVRAPLAALVLALVPCELAAATPDLDQALEWARAALEGDRHARERLAGVGVELAPALLTHMTSQPDDELGTRLRELVDGWSTEPLIASVLNAADADADLAGHLRTIRRLGEIRRPEALRDLFAVTSVMEAQELAHPSVQREIEHALARTLGDDPRIFDRLAREAERAPDAVAFPLVRAVAASALEGSYGLLVDYLDRDRELDREVLRALGALSWTLEDVRRGDSTRTLLAYLGSIDPETRRNAASALATSGDTTALPHLLELLSDRERRVRISAERALQALSGRRFGDDIDAWQAWWDAERSWFRERYDGLVDSALEGEPGPAFAALRQLIQHPAFAKRLAEDLAYATRHSDSSVARAACLALKSLATPAALAALRHVAEEGLDGTREVAAQVLGEARGETARP